MLLLIYGTMFRGFKFFVDYVRIAVVFRCPVYIAEHYLIPGFEAVYLFGSGNVVNFPAAAGYDDGVGVPEYFIKVIHDRTDVAVFV